MRESSSEGNPYASPPTKVVDERKAFRWRLIPITLLCVFAVALLVGFVGHFGLGVWLCFTAPDVMDLRMGSNLAMLLGDLVGITGAVLLLLTAFALKKGRWWVACAAFLSGMCVTSFGSFLGGGS